MCSTFFPLSTSSTKRCYKHNHFKTVQTDCKLNVVLCNIADFACWFKDFHNDKIGKNCATLKLWLEYLLFEIDSEVRVTDSEVRVSAAVYYTLQKKSQSGDMSWAYGGHFFNRSLSV